MRTSIQFVGYSNTHFGANFTLWSPNRSPNFILAVYHIAKTHDFEQFSHCFAPFSRVHIRNSTPLGGDCYIHLTTEASYNAHHFTTNCFYCQALINMIVGFALILCLVEHTNRMDTLLLDAKKLQHELVGHRRYLHAHAETGFDMGKTTAYIKGVLQEYGCTPKKCGKAGLAVTVGKKSGKTILLRADIDGLPITEKTGLAYACKNGNMHACGHDLHATALLGAAKL